MNLRRIPVNIKKIFQVRLKRARVVKDERSDKVKEYTIRCKIDDPEHIPDKEILKLIVLNPWTALSSPPSIQFIKIKNQDTEMVIDFNIINLKEGNRIEQRILEFLRESGNRA
jgi:hypothetical protein